MSSPTCLAFIAAQVGAFESGRMNITLCSLHLMAETLGVRIIDLFKGVEDERRSSLRNRGLRANPPKRLGLIKGRTVVSFRFDTGLPGQPNIVDQFPVLAVSTEGVHPGLAQQ